MVDLILTHILLFYNILLLILNIYLLLLPSKFRQKKETDKGTGTCLVNARQVPVPLSVYQVPQKVR